MATTEVRARSARLRALAAASFGNAKPCHSVGDHDVESSCAGIEVPMR
nr:hypothetical protein JVH1_6845 [Rhodococcus sp. JVH1]